jgi:hypothetical protein
MMLRMRRGVRGLAGCALGDCFASRGFGLALMLLPCRVYFNFIAGVSFLAVCWFAASGDWARALVLLHNYTPVGSNAFYLRIWISFWKAEALVPRRLGAME